MALKKSELYSSLWSGCDELRGGMDTSHYKDYVLVLLFIVVHEMAHLREPTHNPRFIALLDRFMPNWRWHRDQLNQLPVRHEEWGY